MVGYAFRCPSAIDRNRDPANPPYDCVPLCLSLHVALICRSRNLFLKIENNVLLTPSRAYQRGASRSSRNVARDAMDAGRAARRAARSRTVKPCGTSAADLKFLKCLPRVRTGTSNRKRHSNRSFGQRPLLSEVRGMSRRNSGRTSESGRWHPPTLESSLIDDNR